MSDAIERIAGPETDTSEPADTENTVSEMEVLMRGPELDREIDDSFLLSDGASWSLLKEVCDKRGYDFKRFLQHYLGGSRADWHLRRRHEIQRRLRDEAIMAAGGADRLIEIKQQEHEVARLDAETAVYRNIEKVAAEATASGDPVDTLSFQNVLNSSSGNQHYSHRSTRTDRHVVDVTPIAELSHDQKLKDRMIERAHSTARVIEQLMEPDKKLPLDEKPDSDSGEAQPQGR